MYIVFVRNYKRKVLIFTAVLLLWLVLLSVSGSVLNKFLFFKVTINDYLSFSYPFDFEVESIYVNKHLESKNSIQVTTPFQKKTAQNIQSYQSMKGKFSFNYPSIFTLNEQEFTGSDILYHVDFVSKAQNTHGFVEVWNMPYSLENFLNMSKSTSQQTYKYFNEKSILVNNYAGYLWDYTSLGNDNKYYKGMEVFFKRDDRMYRISYFVPEDKWNEAQSKTFWGLVDSFKVN